MDLKVLADELFPEDEVFLGDEREFLLVVPFPPLLAKLRTKEFLSGLLALQRPSCFRAKEL
jgi:hypothetical protein